MIKTLIISADEVAITIISRILHDCCPDVSIIAVSGNQKEAIHRINLNQADLVILDTYLSDGSGFDLLSHFQKPDFRIIFISEYPEYAIRAFDYNAIGYVVKPIREQKFITTVNRAMDAIKYEEKLQLRQLESDMKGLSQAEKLILRTNEEIHSVDMARIIRVEADGSYSSFFIDDGRKIIVSKPMKEYEENLLANGFFRIHKSHIINIKKLKYFEKAEGGYMVMSDGERVPVSSRKRDSVIALLESLD
ncbi:MAG: LytTR family DNA-binding domain-containing protein [Bacteroidales bacterium]|nr:LytTR family DNA-binding domain-containing protein [Bacteroidales bacterium]